MYSTTSYVRGFKLHSKVNSSLARGVKLHSEVGNSPTWLGCDEVAESNEGMTENVKAGEPFERTSTATMSSTFGLLLVSKLFVAFEPAALEPAALVVVDNASSEGSICTSGPPTCSGIVCLATTVPSCDVAACSEIACLAAPMPNRDFVVLLLSFGCVLDFDSSREGSFFAGSVAFDVLEARGTATVVLGNIKILYGGEGFWIRNICCFDL